MKRLSVLLVLALAGCGTVDSIRNSDDTDFVVVSQSEVGGVVKLIKGRTSTCKVSKHGVSGAKYRIVYQDGQCTIEVVK